MRRVSEQVDMINSLPQEMGIRELSEILDMFSMFTKILKRKGVEIGMKKESARPVKTTCLLK